MGDRLSERDFQIFCRQQFNDLRRMLDINHSQFKSLAKSHEVLLLKVEELVNGSSAAVAGYDNDGPASKRPKTIHDAYDNRMQKASVVLQGLFNGNMFGDVRDGQKRACVYFRQICKNPYPKETEIGSLFRESREDVSMVAVTNWLESNSRELMANYRNRRSGLIRFIKEAISMSLGVGRIPMENGSPNVIQEWKLVVSAAWLAAKEAAKIEGLIYPRIVSHFIAEHAKASDPYTTYSSGHCPLDLDNELWWSNLITLEAFALNIISVCFGKRTAGLNIECSQKNLGGALLKETVSVVLHQRSLYELEVVE